MPPRQVIVDANLLVLYVIGSVNRQEVARNKRTSKYTPSDFDLLTRVLDEYDEIIVTPHIAAEVSNLITSLHGDYLDRARTILRIGLQAWQEVYIESRLAAADERFLRLGLTDLTVAKASAGERDILTDDLPLYLALLEAGESARNFTHIQAERWIE